VKRLITLVAILAMTGVVLAGGTGGIAGIVVNSQTGNPISGAMIVARGDSNQMGRARTNARGVYLIEDLGPAHYRVSASARGYEPAVYPRAVGVHEGQVTRGINFRLIPNQQPEPGVITGRVVDHRTGEPIQGAVVVALGKNCRGRARTDDHGRYAIRRLRPGVYRVKAKARHYIKQSFPRPVPVRAGQTVENINFALQPKPHKGAIAGRVINARTHQPIAGAVVIAHGKHGTARAVTGRNGFYRIVRLDPGLYRVTAMKRGYRPETFPRPVPVRAGHATKHVDFFLHQLRVDAD